MHLWHWGCSARYAIGTGVQERLPLSSFPWRTFVINVTGSLVLGFIATLLTERFPASPHRHPPVTIGLVGAYATFSTFEQGTARFPGSYIEDKQRGLIPGDKSPFAY